MTDIVIKGGPRIEEVLRCAFCGDELKGVKDEHGLLHCMERTGEKEVFFCNAFCKDDYHAGAHHVHAPA